MAAESTSSNYTDNVISISRGFGKGPPSGSPPLQPPGGGGTFDDMEARVASLEAHLEYVRRDIADIKGDVSALKKDASDLKVSVATLTERVNHLPSKGFIIVVIVSSLTIATGILTVTPKFQTWLSGPPSATAPTLPKGP